MKKSHRQNRSATTIANVLGSFGYLSIVVQWFWVIATIIIPYMQHSSLESLFVPMTSTPHAAPVQSIELPAGLQIAAMIGAIIFMIAIIMYAIYAVPRSVGRLGKSVTQKSATATVQHMTHHHQPLTEVEKKRAYEYLTWGVKIVLVVIPFALSSIPTHQSLTISHSVVVVVSLFCFSVSFLWFFLQYVIALICRISARDIW